MRKRNFTSYSKMIVEKIDAVLRNLESFSLVDPSVISEILSYIRESDYDEVYNKVINDEITINEFLSNLMYFNSIDYSNSSSYEFKDDLIKINLKDLVIVREALESLDFSSIYHLLPNSMVDDINKQINDNVDGYCTVEYVILYLLESIKKTDLRGNSYTRKCGFGRITKRVYEILNVIGDNALCWDNDEKLCYVNELVNLISLVKFDELYCGDVLFLINSFFNIGDKDEELKKK